jgi:hypothetical protein
MPPRTRKPSTKLQKDLELVKDDSVNEDVNQEEESDGNNENPERTVILSVTLFSGDRDSTRLSLGRMPESQVTNHLQNVIANFNVIRSTTAMLLQGEDGVVHIFNLEKITRIEFDQKVV